MIIIKETKNNDIDFLHLCEKLEEAHKYIIKEQRNKGANCLNGLEKYKTVFVAYENEKPVGCIAITEVQDEVCSIGRVFVREEYRNRGVATKLLNKVEECAKKENARILQLDTYERFIPAVHLYEKFGFRKITKNELSPDFAFSIYMEKNI